jgi:hypothetical protein
VAGAARTDTRAALGSICLLAVSVGLWNVAHYPPYKGVDAAAHIAYASGLVPGGRLPHHVGEYYTPPGYYALAGGAAWVARQLGVNAYSALRVAVALNVPLLLGTVLLAFAIASELWPGRRRIALGAAAFVALLPVCVESEAMFHPEMLSLFLTTLALWLCVRAFSSARYAVALGAALGAAQLVRAFTLWTVGAVVLALLAGRRWRALVVAVVLAAAIPSPWYVHQWLTYHGQPTFPQPPTRQARGAGGAPKPLYERRPLGFYIDPGLPELVSAPYRPHFLNLALPTTYAGIWGDYFGFWAWTARTSGAGGPRATVPPPLSARRRLVIQSLLGLVPTLLALAGALALAASSLRRPRQLAIGVLPLVGLLGFLYFTVGYPTPDGDVIKASYMLTTAPGWAIGFGYALDRLGGRASRVALALLAACALVDLSFIVYG